MYRRSLAILMAGSCILTLPAGCGPAETPAVKDARQLFDTHCARCHAQAGEPGGPKLGSSKGPNLTHIGSEPSRTAEYLANFIRDPKGVRTDAKMPGFGGAMKDEEIQTLAEYLAGRK